jgi:hypothetical protein
MMTRHTLSAAIVLAALAAPAMAAQDKPITQDNPDAVDVAKTPVTDLNLDQKEIPPLLIEAQRQPYDLNGLGRCSQLIRAVEQLDDLLGADIDLPQEARDRINAGRVAKTVVGSFIPFRGLIREVSGANEHDRKVRAAIQAGLARRGFLKGVGLSRGCKYPARPATREIIASYMAQRQAEQEAKADKDRDNNGKQYVSKPVIQKTD